MNDLADEHAVNSNATLLFLRLYAVLELHQASDPTPERERLIQRLRVLRNKLVHHVDLDPAEQNTMAESTAELIDYLDLVEGSSLGSEQAQANRLLTPAREINEVLQRSAAQAALRDAARRAREVRNGADTAAEIDQLAAAASTGDEQAALELTSRIRPLIIRYCRARADRDNEAQVAEQIAEKALDTVLQALPQYQHHEGNRFLAFAYGVTAHVFTQHRRAAGTAASDSSQPIEANTDNISDVLSNRMAELLQHLPAKQREIVVLRVVVGLSAEETAQAVGSTTSAVRVAQHRALQRIRSLLGDDALPN